MNSRERVYKTLQFDGPDKIPVDIWVLPASQLRHGETLTALINARGLDFGRVPYFDPTSDARHYEIGSYVDAWGCEWHNKQRGITGEVKVWPLADDAKIASYKSPLWMLKESAAHMFDGTDDYFKATEDKFQLCGWISLFERMQFLRGTENLFMDIAEENDEFFTIRDIVLEYLTTYVTLICKVGGVDAITIGDDWGSQISMLINPDTWRRLFKPAYMELINIAKAHGKLVFFHSDGYVLDLYDEWIEMGVSAVNTQIWCMGVDKVAAKAAGKITFWGELSRQDTLVKNNQQDVLDKVELMKNNLYKNGGLIGQFETNLDVSLETIKTALYAW